MKSCTAVDFEAGKPLEIVEVDVACPQPGEVLFEIKATGFCHTDAFTLSGDDPEGAFPAIFGHEGARIVREVGAGVTSIADIYMDGRIQIDPLITHKMPPEKINDAFDLMHRREIYEKCC